MQQIHHLFYNFGISLDLQHICIHPIAGGLSYVRLHCNAASARDVKPEQRVVVFFNRVRRPLRKTFQVRVAGPAKGRPVRRPSTYHKNNFKQTKTKTKDTRVVRTRTGVRKPWGSTLICNHLCARKKLQPCYRGDGGSKNKSRRDKRAERWHRRMWRMRCRVH